jgi:hypothetical protein
MYTNNFIFLILSLYRCIRFIKQCVCLLLFIDGARTAFSVISIQFSLQHNNDKAFISLSSFSKVLLRGYHVTFSVVETKIIIFYHLTSYSLAGRFQTFPSNVLSPI